LEPHKGRHRRRYASADGKTKPAELDPEFQSYKSVYLGFWALILHPTQPAPLFPQLQVPGENQGTTLRKDYGLVWKILESQPQLTNNVLYTIAVTTEALCLSPPASCSRLGKAGVGYGKGMFFR